MFSRSSKRRKVVSKKATIKVIKPEQSENKEPALDLSKAKITIIKPEAGLKIMVEEEKEGEDE